MKKIFALFALVFSFFSTSVFAAVEIDKKFDHVDLVIILDKSGSMHGMESDTIGGFNSMLDKQRKLDVKTDVTTVMFNNKSDYIHERKPLGDIKNITGDDYVPQGTTALLDCVGETIDKVSGYYAVNDKKNKVIFAIITDGKENSSREYTKKIVKKLIEDKKESGWEFIFLGANIDAVSEAGAIGITSDRVVQYKATKMGVRKNFDAVASFAEEAVVGNSVSDNWKEKAEQDTPKK
ncbi:vWA domain-containing protein [Succinivibrio dextrinosolvens]|uniref:vWA domain-containing protein n=1 Tax=Succinivibrio dextrinosolvens TaxID=83771 RepID=UPI0019215C8B|nr:vWA domain-containing protein [Succinivibrio dextrinosolvens]